METALAELKDRLAKLTDLRRAEGLLVWDMQVFMPPGGAPTRATQLATLEEVLHERLVDDGLGELLEELAPYEASLPHDSDDASPHPRRAEGLGPRTPRAGGARGRVRASRGRVVLGLGGGARELRLRGVPPVARAHRRAPPPASSSATRRTTTRTTSCSRTTSRACGPPRSARSSPCSRRRCASWSPRTRPTRTTRSCAARSRSRRRTRSRASCARRSARRGTSSGSTRPSIRSRSRSASATSA